MLILPRGLEESKPTADKVSPGIKTDTLEKIINNAKPLLEQINQIIFIKNTDFQYVDCNKKLIEFSRLNNEKRIIGYEDYDLPWAEDTEFYRKVDKEVLMGEEKKILMTVRVASGEKIPAIQNKKAIREPGTGKVIGIIASMTEIYSASLNDFLNNIKDKDAEILSEVRATPLNYKIYHCTKYNLTPREFECLFYLLRGMTYKMIADILKKSPRTIEKFITGVKYKMGCTNKTELVEKSIKDGLIDLIPPNININDINAHLNRD